MAEIKIELEDGSAPDIKLISEIKSELADTSVINHDPNEVIVKLECDHGEYPTCSNIQLDELPRLSCGFEIEIDNAEALHSDLKVKLKGIFLFEHKAHIIIYKAPGTSKLKYNAKCLMLNVLTLLQSVL